VVLVRASLLQAADCLETRRLRRTKRCSRQDCSAPRRHRSPKRQGHCLATQRLLRKHHRREAYLEARNLRRSLHRQQALSDRRHQLSPSRLVGSSALLQLHNRSRQARYLARHQLHKHSRLAACLEGLPRNRRDQVDCSDLRQQLNPNRQAVCSEHLQQRSRQRRWVASLVRRQHSNNHSRQQEVYLAPRWLVRALAVSLAKASQQARSCEYIS
jgi:hypothetical protein